MERKFKMMVGQLNRHYDSNLEKVNQASMESVLAAKTPLFAQLGKLSPEECWKLLREIGNLESIEENYTFLLGLTDYIACECNELGLHIPPGEATLWDYNPLRYIEELAQTWKKFLPSARADLMPDSFNFLVSSLIDSLSTMISKQVNVSSFEAIVVDIKMLLPAGKHYLLSKVKIPKPDDDKIVTKTNRKKNNWKLYQAPILQHLKFKPLKVNGNIKRNSVVKKKSPQLQKRDTLVDMPLSVPSSSESSSGSSSPPMSSCDDAFYLLESDDEDLMIYWMLSNLSSDMSSSDSSMEEDEKPVENDHSMMPNGHSNTKSYDLNEAFYSISDSSCSSILSSADSDDPLVLFNPFEDLKLGDTLGRNGGLSALNSPLGDIKDSITSAKRSRSLSSNARSVGQLSETTSGKDEDSKKRKVNPSLKDIGNFKEDKKMKQHDLNKKWNQDSSQSKGDAFSVMMTSRSKDKAALCKKQKVRRN